MEPNKIPKRAPITIEPEKIMKICFLVAIRGYVSKSVLQHLSHKPRLMNSVSEKVSANDKEIPRVAYSGIFALEESVDQLFSKIKLKIPDRNTRKAKPNKKILFCLSSTDFKILHVRAKPRRMKAMPKTTAKTYVIEISMRLLATTSAITTPTTMPTKAETVLFATRAVVVSGSISPAHAHAGLYVEEN